MILNIAKMLATLSQSARDQKLLAQGRLVSPSQMADLPFSHDVLPDDAWLLVGELHPELFALLKGSGRLNVDVTLLEANIGIFYLVVRHAIGGWEHRFVLPMAGASARAYVDSMEKYGVHAALTSTGNTNAFLNHLQRNSSDEVVAKLLATDIMDFVGDGSEPPRVLRRLQHLRRWSHDQVKQVLTRGPRARRAHGAGAPSRLPVAVGSD